MATLSKESTVDVQASADTTWDYIIWEQWPILQSNGMHSPVRDDQKHRFEFQYGRGSGRAVGTFVVTPTGPNTCALNVCWQALDIGFVVAATLGGRNQKVVNAMSASLKAGAEARAAAK